jgi:hypothetical protein
MEDPLVTYTREKFSNVKGTFEIRDVPDEGSVERQCPTCGGPLPVEPKVFPRPGLTFHPNVGKSGADDLQLIKEALRLIVQELQIILEWK